MFDQKRAQLDHSYQKHWVRSPKIISKIWGDGPDPYRETGEAGGLEVDRYRLGDKHVPDYLFALMKRDAEIEMAGGPTMPPYYLKMDVDLGKPGIRSFLGDLHHLILRKSTNQRLVAEALKKRFGAVVGETVIKPPSP